MLPQGSSMDELCSRPVRSVCVAPPDSDRQVLDRLAILEGGTCFAVSLRLDQNVFVFFDSESIVSNL